MRTLRVAASAAMLLAAACGDNPSSPPAANKLPAGEVVALTPLTGFSPHYSAFDKPARVVVTSDTIWARIAGELFTQGAARPAIDFSREIVLFAAMGTRSSGGFRIEIERAVRTDGAVVAEVVETSPGGNCISTQALTRPVYAVRMARPDASVSFVERKVVHECS
ncbi:protease complex subunit PrcB family protein [Longimicrobium terrae]|uniref:PrcB C-terminal domain-containing protein n=1 Tax=Longimicrobium terrae TaxID=1639882 RepID=A0A841GLN5_9BACT|nr:protease complex subunit PrcB family protein [Longimicrobium terrae]MBB4635287.1 hypothetical protein [Longimicrobium terrae]MBB6069681.1 hypothetical protein [Longimicrobium terrae]NNC31108.1 protease complex subunit PrcB family protein [Longimicrobium terrae]